MRYPERGILLNKMNKITQKIVAGFMAAGIFLNSSTIPFLPEIYGKEIDKVIIPTNKIRVVATAYSSTVEQTDDTPHITASNKQVYDGILAANFLKFGTKVKIPKFFGEKIFTVEDRMNRRFNDANPPRVDVWFSTVAEARKFGVKTLDIEVYN